MSQATLLGICSDNVVTILHPSSMIECPLGPTSSPLLGPFPFLGTSVTISTNSPALLSGYVTFPVSIPVAIQPASVSVTVGTFAATYPVPTGYSGPIVIPFQAATNGVPVTLATTEVNVTVAAPTYSYSVVSN